jgi:hypothetical protein
MYDLYFHKHNGDNDKLRGTVVLVRPDLEIDPLNKRNHVGVICEGDIDFDNIYVDFKYSVAVFSSESLFSFFPGDKIQQTLAFSPSTLNPADSMALRRVAVLVLFGDVTDKIKAMLTVSDYPAIQPFCVETLQDQIFRDLIQHYGRD